MSEKILRGKEAEFTLRLEKELSTNLSEYYVTRGESLIYKFYVDSEGQLQPKKFVDALVQGQLEPEKFKTPKRGQLAFQTDLMIKRKLRLMFPLTGIPLVVIEVKFGSFTTHDILTYSAKAMRHKEIYPYLRYGLIVGEARKIDNRFFTHNTGFDFAVAIEKSESLSEVTDIIKRQCQAAERMLMVLQKRIAVKRYITNNELTPNSS